MTKAKKTPPTLKFRRELPIRTNSPLRLKLNGTNEDDQAREQAFRRLLAVRGCVRSAGERAASALGAAPDVPVGPEFHQGIADARQGSDRVMALLKKVEDEGNTDAVDLAYELQNLIRLDCTTQVIMKHGAAIGEKFVMDDGRQAGRDKLKAANDIENADFEKWAHEYILPRYRELVREDSKGGRTPKWSGIAGSLAEEFDLTASQAIRLEQKLRQVLTSC